MPNAAVLLPCCCKLGRRSESTDTCHAVPEKYLPVRFWHVCVLIYLLPAQGNKSKRRPAQPKTPAGVSREADTSDSNGGGKRSSGGKKARAGRPQ